MQKQVTKPANKTNAKPAAKQATKPAVKQYADLLKACLSGSYGTAIAGFYVSAMSYHFKRQTAFPRGRIASVKLMAIDEAIKFIRTHEKTSIPAGSHDGQRLFDAMICEAYPAGKITK
jgi:hypothetical protein